MKWSKPKIILIIGMRGSAKTCDVIYQILPEYITTHPNSYTLVFDQEINKNYLHFELLGEKSIESWRRALLRRKIKTPIMAVHLKDLPRIKHGIVRVLPEDSADMANYSEEVLAKLRNDRTIRNCLVILEDSARFLTNKNIQGNFESLIINAKQRPMDLVFIYHGWMKVPPALFEWVNELYLHKTKTSAIERKNYIGDDLPVILEAEKRINANKNPYYFEKLTLIETE